MKAYGVTIPGNEAGTTVSYEVTIRGSEGRVRFSTSNSTNLADKHAEKALRLRRDDVRLIEVKRKEIRRYPDEMKHSSNCTCDEGHDLHPCPYEEDIDANSDNICDCCPSCTKNCKENT